ncbi:MAG: alkaline phosphatase family protein [Acidimicrobiia bacterium]
MTNDAGTRVVFLILDGLPVEVVEPSTMPVLTGWCTDSGTSPHSIPAVMPASTYPNHATWVTGELPVVHGIVGNHVLDGGGRFRAARDVGPGVPTIFDAVNAAGLTSSVVVSDQDLIGVMGAHAATTHWPPGGAIPDGASTDAHGYLDDSVTLPWLIRAVSGDAHLVVGHLNAPDTAGHVYGPDAAHEVYRETDTRLASVRDAIESAADDRVVVVVSDHAHETITERAPIDLSPALEGTGLQWFPEGSAGVVYGARDELASLLADTPGVAGIEALAPEVHVVWGEEGCWLCFAGIDAEPGMHGSPRTARQLAAVVGTHPAVPELDARVAGPGFDATSWYAELRGLLGIA